MAVCWLFTVALLMASRRCLASYYSLQHRHAPRLLMIAVIFTIWFGLYWFVVVGRKKQAQVVALSFRSAMVEPGFSPLGKNVFGVVKLLQ